MASVRFGTKKETLIETTVGYKRRAGWLSDESVQKLAVRYGWTVIKVTRT